MGSEDTFIFSVLLQTKILHPLLYGLGVYVTKPGIYAMVGIKPNIESVTIIGKCESQSGPRQMNVSHSFTICI